MNRGTITYSTAKVIDNIRHIFEVREDETIELAKVYAAKTLAIFVQVQTSKGLKKRGEFWTNRTGRAAASYWAKAFSVGRKGEKNIGYFIRHGAATWYATALEDWVETTQGVSSPEAMIRKTAWDFFEDVRRLHEG